MAQNVRDSSQGPAQTFSSSEETLLAARQRAMMRLERWRSRPFPQVMQADPRWREKAETFHSLMAEIGTIAAAGALPRVDLVDGLPSRFHHVTVIRAVPAAYKAYVRNMLMGIGVIVGCAGTGKTQLAAVAVATMAYNANIGRVVASTPSEGATNVLARAIENVADTVFMQYSNFATSKALHRLMILRGYPLRLEVHACAAMLKGEAVRFNVGGPWKPHQSLCYWTLRALGFRRSTIPGLSNRDCPALVQLSRALASLANASINGLQEHFYKGKNLQPFRHLARIARGAVTWQELINDRRECAGEESLRADLASLMDLVTSCAQVVITTPVLFSENPYERFNNFDARGVVLDEAGNMDRADGLIVVGNCPRPMFLVGDPDQMGPRVIPEPGDAYHFTPASILSAFTEIQWPVLRLNQQLRMARGMFDTALRAIYPRGVRTWHQYTRLCDVARFPVGARIRQYLSVEYNAASPRNRWAPLFFQCEDCPCQIDEATGSVSNPRAVAIMASCLRKFMAATGVPAGDITVLTPFAENLEVINGVFRRYPDLSGVPRCLLDHFQGREAEVIILALCVSRETGPLFTADPGRLALAFSRHKSTLLVFGDLDTVERINVERFDRGEYHNGASKAAIAHATMGRCFAEFRRTSHVTNMAPNQNFGPYAVKVGENGEVAGGLPLSPWLVVLGLFLVAAYHNL